MLNWQKPAEYPDGVSTSSGQWAWEFLRRNPLYQADWADYTTRSAAILRKFGEACIDREATEVAFNQDDSLGTVYQPERKEGETSQQWLARVGKGKRIPLAQWLCRKWGVRGALADPESPGPAVIWENSHSAIHEVVGDRGADKAALSTRPAIEFDLSRPLEPQFAAARKYLISRARKSNQRRRPGIEYQRHLRLLDALAALGAVDTAKPSTRIIREIGETLYPKDQNPKPQFPRDAKIRAMIPVARALRDRGYRQLPAMPEQTASRKIRKK